MVSFTTMQLYKINFNLTAFSILILLAACGGGGNSSEPADTTPPVITIEGVNPINIIENTTYNDAGAIATDAVDGVVEVSVVGTVDTSTIASYVITYTATDTSGNSASVTRIVNVVMDDSTDTTSPVVTSIGLLAISFGLSTRIITHTQDINQTYYSVQIQNDEGKYVDELFLSVIEYTEGLESWFVQNVDPNGMLIGRDTFSKVTYTNGVEALLLNGVVPGEFGNIYGPVSTAYGIDQSSTKIIVANVSQGSQFILTQGTENVSQIVDSFISSIMF